MALKLGEMLLHEKLITEEQLDEALKCQVIFGIRLGSSLIELGFISEEQLSRFLGSKLGVPYANPKSMTSVSPEVLALIPRELAEKYRVFPLTLEKRCLSLVMSDPADFAAIDEISFATGYRVQPLIAPDIRIAYALEKFYNVKRDSRYLRVSGSLHGMRRQPKPTAMEAATASARVCKEPKKENIEVSFTREDGELLHIEIPAEFEGFGVLPDLPDEKVDSKAKTISRYSIDRLSTDFATAQTRDEIADTFIKYLGQEFSHGALFIVRGNSAVGWRGISNNKKIEGFEQLSIALEKPSVIRDIVASKQFSMGSLINTPENSKILKAFEVSQMTPLLVVPVVMLKKVVAAVIVSADMEALGKRLLELQKLVHKSSLAFEMLIIKNKILMT